jgi:hypothetical protein
LWSVKQRYFSYVATNLKKSEKPEILSRAAPLDRRKASAFALGLHVYESALEHHRGDRFGRLVHFPPHYGFLVRRCHTPTFAPQRPRLVAHQDLISSKNTLASSKKKHSSHKPKKYFLLPRGGPDKGFDFRQTVLSAMMGPRRPTRVGASSSQQPAQSVRNGVRFCPAAASNVRPFSAPQRSSPYKPSAGGHGAKGTAAGRAASAGKVSQKLPSAKGTKKKKKKACDAPATASEPHGFGATYEDGGYRVDILAKLLDKSTIENASLQVAVDALTEKLRAAAGQSAEPNPHYSPNTWQHGPDPGERPGAGPDAVDPVVGVLWEEVAELREQLVEQDDRAHAAAEQALPAHPSASDAGAAPRHASSAPTRSRARQAASMRAALSTAASEHAELRAEVVALRAGAGRAQLDEPRAPGRLFCEREAEFQVSLPESRRERAHGGARGAAARPGLKAGGSRACGGQGAPRRRCGCGR